jgi:hypothetical protein
MSYDSHTFQMHIYTCKGYIGHLQQTSPYVYIYIYIYVCVCVCVRTVGSGSFPGVKRQERGVDHPPEKSYTTTPPLDFRPVIGWNLHLHLPYTGRSRSLCVPDDCNT